MPQTFLQNLHQNAAEFQNGSNIFAVDSAGFLCCDLFSAELAHPAHSKRAHASSTKNDEMRLVLLSHLFALVWITRDHKALTRVHKWLFVGASFHVQGSNLTLPLIWTWAMLALKWRSAQC
jgi:hypothetical protein